MKKYFAFLFVLCLASIMFVQWASAQSPSADWNSNWQFQNALEKSNVLSQAMAMKFVESDGFNTTINSNMTTNDTYFQEQNCTVNGSCANNTAIAIGNNIEVAGDGNLITTENDGNVGSQTNNGSGNTLIGDDQVTIIP